MEQLSCGRGCKRLDFLGEDQKCFVKCEEKFSFIFVIKVTVGFTTSCENKAVGNQLGLGPRVYVNCVISNMISYFIQSRSEKAVKFSEIKACNSSDSRKLNFQKKLLPRLLLRTSSN